MGTKDKVALFVLTTVSSLILLTSLTKSNQAIVIPEKTSGLLPGEMSFSVQEKVKYLYVGMEKCASVCHNNEDMGFQFNIMKDGPHSNAFKILVSDKAVRYAKKANVKENPQESPVCLKCHITGGGLDSSFFATTYKKEDGVTCEACHKGAYITKAFIPKETDCLKCHNDSVHRMHHFNFRENCEKIAHPRPKAKLKET
jgi:Cytochrome c554 and c-prime